MKHKSIIKYGQLMLILSFLLIAVLASPNISASTVQAVAQETCPNGGDWVKVEPIDAQSYTYTAPAGKEIVETCYKAGTTLRYANVNPAQSSITLTSDVPNPNNNAYKDISHASFRLQVITVPTPPPASASVSLGTCSPGEPGGTSSNAVIITTDHATVSIDGETYNASSTIYLAPGNYPWTWNADEGYSGGGSGTLVVDDCTPKLTADAQVSVGACFYGEGGFGREVALSIEGASLTITGAGGTIGTFTSSQNITLPVGDYTYTWVASAPGYEGSGSGSLPITECDPTQATAKVDIGACKDVEGGKAKEVNIGVENAIFSIDGIQYTEPTTIVLTPGEYPYSWEPISGEFTGSGEGVISIVACDPKVTVDPQPDPKPDQAAGGMGPSLINSLTPFVLGISGVGTVSALVIYAKKKRDQ